MYGATGKTGSRVTDELLSRGHEVVAISRSTEAAFAGKANVKAVNDDLSDVSRIASLIKGTDAVVSAYGPPADDAAQVVGATDRLVQAVKKNGGPRLLVVGGAGSLFVAPGVTLRASGHLPPEWLPIVDAHIEVLKNIRESDIN